MKRKFYKKKTKLRRNIAFIKSQFVYAEKKEGKKERKKERKKGKIEMSV